MTINARALEHALVKMFSHPLEEVRHIGAEIKTCAVQSIPTLLKYASADEELSEAISPKQIIESPESTTPDQGWCQLLDSPTDAENRILAAYLYRLQNISYTQSLARIQQAPAAEKNRVAEMLLKTNSPHAIPLREMEHVNFTFDVLLDQGAYYEVKRHRMMTLTPQSLTTRLGYALPKAITAAGQSEAFCTAMAAAKQTYEHIYAVSSAAAAYVVPNAYNRRFLITTNLRSLFHFIQLRSAENAHFSVRRLAQCFADELNRLLPAFTQYLPVNSIESVDSIESAYFSDTMKV
jgi:thymidylate synthase ThyX